MVQSLPGLGRVSLLILLDRFLFPSFDKRTSLGFDK